MWEAEGERTFPYSQTLIMGEWILEQQGKGRTSNEGHNEYTTDLVALESRVSPAQSTVPPLLSTVLTPVKIPIWR